MRIIWNNAKLEKNLKKHGLHFEIAQFVFDDPHHLCEQDRIENNEYRWQTIGMVGSVLIMVGHDFEEKDGAEIIRIITARKATPRAFPKFMYCIRPALKTPSPFGRGTG